MKRTQTIWRWAIYIAGVAIVSFGIALSAKTGLGVSPITAIPYSISQFTNISLATLLFLLYVIMIVLQMLIRKKEYEKRDLLQLPASFVFSVLIDLADKLIGNIHYELLWQNLLLLFAATVLIGIGSGMMVPMKIVPNPADGLVRALSYSTHKTIGTAKNIVDISCVAIAVICDLIFMYRIVSIGIGTIITMLLTGRVIAVFHHFTKEKMLSLSGLSE